MTERAEAVKAGGQSVTVYGVVAMVLGLLAMVAPAVAGHLIAMILGILVLIGGIVRMAWALQGGHGGRGALRFVIGVLTLLCGVALVANPLFASGVLSIVLAVYFILDGLAEAIAGFTMRPRPGWGWMLVGGVVSMLLGAMIWRQYPLSGAWAMGVLIGVKLFFVGLLMVAAGSAARSAVKAQTGARE